MNPFEIQKKMFEEWEKNLSEYLENTMRQPEFMKLVGKNLEVTMNLQGAVKGHVQKALKALSIPTEKELTSLYRTVNDLETRMLDLEEKLEDLGDELRDARRKAPVKKMVKRKKKAAKKKKVVKKKATKKKVAKKKARPKKKAASRKRR